MSHSQVYLVSQSVALFNVNPESLKDVEESYLLCPQK